METIYILHNLGSAEALNHSLHLPSDVRSDPKVKLAVEISLAYKHWNFIRMLRSFRKLPFLIFCSVYQHLEKIRRHSLEVINVAYSSKNCQFPIKVLKEWLMYNDEDAVKIACNHYGLSNNGKFICFLKSSYDSQVKTLHPVKEYVLQEKAKTIDLVSVLNGVS
ncbi:SAC3 domain-containing protein 1-like [Centruroides sculpturatus]|uniref:SAC3 domain-containing protein 1-like n=1 Tax=Centruroides sculpturatus TaxID=218467 RepID=UPI000C6E8760|nr:SAC3 domain-containing protein 1-like [Centruroides sculpturatus]XP_023209704.1 SAC3 domain-containing protein 1-like [Centruroides sculpturatus]